MAAGTIPAPGTKYGPCTESCVHQDCAANRRMAAHTCRLCGKEIGYGVRFYRDPESSNPEASVHADCLEEQVAPVHNPVGFVLDAVFGKKLTGSP